MSDDIRVCVSPILSDEFWWAERALGGTAVRLRAELPVSEKPSLIYAITHADRTADPDPVHTEKGRAQLSEVFNRLPKHLHQAANIPLVVVGFGRRFREMYNMLCSTIPGFCEIPVVFTFSCGGEWSRNRARDTVTLGSGGRLPNDDFIGLWSGDWSNVWIWASQLPGNTLLCTGRELIHAFGGTRRNVPTEAQVFVINPSEKRVRRLPNKPRTQTVKYVFPAPHNTPAGNKCVFLRVSEEDEDDYDIVLGHVRLKDGIKNKCSWCRREEFCPRSIDNKFLFAVNLPERWH